MMGQILSWLLRTPAPIALSLWFLFPFLRRREPGRIISAAALTAAALFVSQGTAESVWFWLARRLGTAEPSALWWLGPLAGTLSLALLAGFLAGAKRVLGAGNLRGVAAAVIACPALFIAVAEGTASAAVYGNTIIWAWGRGLVWPEAGGGELLALHLSACAGYAALLAAYRYLEHAAEAEQREKLLNQQAAAQSVYLQEAQLRERQTSAFRHDIRNHLLLVRELLERGEMEQAERYLSRMEGLTKRLSYPCRTGDGAVDALLGAKLAAAEQRGIALHCQLRIPEGVEAMDWCVLLGNALDNAIQALEGVQKGYIYLMGATQGNCFLLEVENRCGTETGVVREGIGLQNIRAAAEKYGGRMEYTWSEGVFRLSVLLVLSRQ